MPWAKRALISGVRKLANATLDCTPATAAAAAAAAAMSGLSICPNGRELVGDRAFNGVYR